MKSLFTFLVILGLLTACNQSDQNKTVPGSRSDTTTVAGKPRATYRVVVFQRKKGKRYDDDEYELMIRDFESQINQAIAEGWEPVGGITAVGMFGLPIQAMMKRE